LDELKETARETFLGRNPRNDLRARLHADHAEVARLLDELVATDIEEAEVRAETRSDIATLLDAHAKAEEETVYEVLRREAGMRTPVRRAMNEHEQIDRCLLELGSCDPSDPMFLRLARELRDVVEHHVHEEETEFLPRAERICGREYLAGLISRFDQAKEALLGDFVPHRDRRARARRRTGLGGLLDMPSRG
jgi:hypothetical protein